MNTKQQILEVAKEHMLLYGIRSVSMDDIARKCGISKKTIYQHFDNKSTMVDSLLRTHISQEKETVLHIRSNSVNAIDEIITIARSVISYMKVMRPILIYDLRKYYPNLWKVVEQNHLEFVEQNIKENILRGKKEGLYLKDIDEAICAKIYVQNSLLINDPSVFPEEEFKRADLFKAIILNHIRGMISEEGRKMLDKTTIIKE